MTAVIVTYNSARTIGDALEGAKRCHDAGLLECIVVDNDSRDDTVALAGAHAWARTIATGKNLGFGRGCNRGLAEVRTPYTLFLNPDGRIDPEALRVLIGFMEAHPKAAICGPAIVEGEVEHPEGLQVTGEVPTPWYTIRAAFPFARSDSFLRQIRPGGEPFRTGWVCGAALMGRTEVLNTLGGFDPRFFLYFEETDLCRRAAAAGHEVWAVGQAVAHHIAAASAKGTGQRMFRGCLAQHYFASRYYYLKKHHGAIPAITTEIAEAALFAVRYPLDLLRGDEPAFTARWRGPIGREPAPVDEVLTTGPRTARTQSGQESPA